MAVDQSAFQTQGSIPRTVPSYFVKDKNGVIAEVEIGYDQFKPPVDGSYHLKLKGMTAPFEMDGQYGPSKNIRVAILVKAPGTGNDKRMFSQMLAIAKKDKQGKWYPNITAKSAVGQMIGCIRGKEIAENEPINLLDYLNGEFRAMVQQTTKTTENGVEVYGNIIKDTWKPVGEQSPEAVPEPEPQPVAAAVNGNPFMTDDDD